MAKFLMMNRAVVLMLAASMTLACQTAFAETDGEQQEATVISIEQDETSPAEDASAQSTQAPDAKPVKSDASDPVVHDDAANASNDAPKPDKKDEGVAAPGIPSTNPDDANKHPAWRKREADKAKGDLQALRHAMQQEAQ